MCFECQKTFCPAVCPEHIEINPACVLCGTPLSSADSARFDRNGNGFCKECIESLPIDEILRICGVSDISSLIDHCVSDDADGIGSETKKMSNICS